MTPATRAARFSTSRRETDGVHPVTSPARASPSSAADRDTLLLAAAHHTAGHVKFGDPLECYRRFGEALGVPA